MSSNVHLSFCGLTFVCTSVCPSRKTGLERFRADSGLAPGGGSAGAEPKIAGPKLWFSRFQVRTRTSLIVGGRPPSEDHRSTRTFLPTWPAGGTGMFSATIHGPPFGKMMTVRVSICTVEARVDTGTRGRAASRAGANEGVPFRCSRPPVVGRQRRGQRPSDDFG